MPKMSLLISLTFLITFAITASPFDDVNIAILDFEGAGLQNNAIIMASDKFRASFIESSKYRVMERSSMNDVLKEQGFQQTGTCNSNSCLISAGELLGVSYILAGRFSQVSGISAISARIIDIKTGEILLAKNSEYKTEFFDFISSDIPIFVRDFNVALEQSIKKFAERHPKDILFIESSPENGRILIDDAETEKLTPATFHDIGAGKHTIQVNSGKMAGTCEITVTPGKLEKCTVNLVPGVGSLRVQSVTPGLPVSVSGKGNFTTPFQIDSLEAGEYTIKSERNDYFPYQSTITVSILKTTELMLTVQPVSFLFFENLAAMADVKIDGIHVEMDGSRLCRLVPGNHIIQTRRPCFKDGNFTIKTVPGDTSILTITYSPLPGRIQIFSAPAKAGIILNGIFQGRTPAIFNDMVPGTYSLTLTNRTHKPITKNFTLDPGVILTVQETFRQYSDNYTAWEARQKKLLYTDYFFAGAGRIQLKTDAPGILFLGAGLASDALFGFSTYKYYSHYKKSHLSRSDIELNYFQHRKSEDLVWAASAAVTSLTFRLLTSYLTGKKDFQ